MLSSQNAKIPEDSTWISLSNKRKFICVTNPSAAPRFDQNFAHLCFVLVLSLYFLHSCWRLLGAGTASSLWKGEGSPFLQWTEVLELTNLGSYCGQRMPCILGLGYCAFLSQSLGWERLYWLVHTQSRQWVSLTQTLLSGGGRAGVNARKAKLTVPTPCDGRGHYSTKASRRATSPQIIYLANSV